MTTEMNRLDRQINYSMMQNYKKIETDVEKNVVSRINEQYKDEFTKQLEEAKDSLAMSVTKELLTKIKDSYKESNLNDCANAIDNQIKKLDVKG